VRSGLTFKRPERSVSALRRSATFRAKGSGGDAAGPEDGARGDGARGFAVPIADTFRVDLGDEGAEHDFNAEVLDELFRFGGEIFGIRRENARAAFIRMMRASCGRMRRKSCFRV